MRTLTIVAAALMATAACGSQSKTDTTTPTTTAPAANGPTAVSKPTTSAPATPAQAVMKRWAAASNKADWDALESLYAADAVVVAAGMPQPIKGAKAIVKFFKTFHHAFPDMKSWPTHSLAKGNTVASVAIIKGTHKNAMGPVPATNKEASFVGLQISAIKNGKIVRQDLYADNYNFLAQLGVVRDNHRPVWIGSVPTVQTAVSSGSATETKNLAVVDKLLEKFNAHDAMAAVALYTPRAWLDDQAAPRRVGGNGEILKEYKHLFTMFPDVALQNPSSWAAGDFVVTTYTFHGKNSGNVPGAPATGKTVNLPAASMFQLKNGKITTHWVFWDGMVFRMQLGVLNIP